MAFEKMLFQSNFGSKCKLVTEGCLASKNCMNRDPYLSAVTVSASPNSYSFYENIGFNTQGDEIDDDGMRFTPMRKLVQIS
jgi:predicted GNAT family N-acyltransferase